MRHRLSIAILALGTKLVTACHAFAAIPQVEQWGTFEVSLTGPTNGNPFVDVYLYARFYQGSVSKKVWGFYDGDGVYRIRFMPPAKGKWRYVTTSNVKELHGIEGEFEVVSPSPGNHGPVHVTNVFHFAYADGTPFRPLGTTVYAWIHQSLELQERTLKTLANSPFNKLRFCVFPKWYDWNRTEPLMYPFEGTRGNFDKTRFNVKFFQLLDRRIQDLMKLGIEADVILFHPYDEGHWGFDRMTRSEDERYLRYVIARLGAFRNVWWSLANEYDFMECKSEEDWYHIGEFVSKTDPFDHLLSIHNGYKLFNHTLPWITHASIQNGAAVENPNSAVLYRDAYRKPVIYDEIKYEGDIPRRWGNLSAEELVFRFWNATIAGCYATHGETYLSPDEILWWSKGGELKGQSPARLAFLRQVLESAPPNGIEPIDKWQNPEYGGKAPDFYLVYFGKATPKEWEFRLPKRALESGMTFKVEILDTWNMTVTPVDDLFVVEKSGLYFFADKDGKKVQLPGRPYIALRITRQK